MLLDHFGNSTETFKNRYWINGTYYEPGGPVFIFDSGEQNAEPLLPYYLQEYHGLSATMRLAKRYRGLAILWEHRFYGASLPFPVNAITLNQENTTFDQWKYLTTDQALEDVVFFANSFPTSSNDPASQPAIHPSITPWIWLGGSYPGVRGALMRVRNPEVIFASWASSAPVHAQVDMASYYKAAERSLTRNCSADWVAVTKCVDQVLNGTDETRRADMKFDLEFARLSGKVLLCWTCSIELTTVYKYYGFAESLLPFCNLLETQNFTADPLESGISNAHGIQAAFDAFLAALAELDYDSIPGEPDDPVTDRSWMWQYCSEYGFYQRGDPNNPLSIETSFLSLELFQEQCNSAFPVGLPTSPAVDHINKYGSWEMSPSNVLFTNGEFDPWRTMGLASIETNSPHRQPNLTVPEYVIFLVCSLHQF
ncbi:peptidase S28 [Fomitiporia mediterranea MF3/22]|uniref:peptidase S28 n=1 Tax=Fomitiporia mediterranea (strain MF3/22) TaxID=694068 RepID=UPI0004408C11|nr:peptidase S28 [Fomitiporia mediterranea MF3/22]EJD00034.1 peptidase S28 [Fomitiporia mediterranea MF3/22]